MVWVRSRAWSGRVPESIVEMLARVGGSGAGARVPEEPLNLVLALPRDACGPLMFQNASSDKFYEGAALLAERGNCPFAEKAWHAHRAGAKALLVINGRDKPFDRPTAGYATDAEPTPTPEGLAVALVHADASVGLVAAAAAAIRGWGDGAVDAAQLRNVWRARFERWGFIARETIVDARQPPWDDRDRTTVRVVPLECRAGSAECQPLLENERSAVRSPRGYSVETRRRGGDVEIRSTRPARQRRYPTPTPASWRPTAAATKSSRAPGAASCPRGRSRSSGPSRRTSARGRRTSSAGAWGCSARAAATGSFTREHPARWWSRAAAAARSRPRRSTRRPSAPGRTSNCGLPSRAC